MGLDGIRLDWVGLDWMDWIDGIDGIRLDSIRLDELDGNWMRWDWIGLDMWIGLDRIGWEWIDSIGYVSEWIVLIELKQDTSSNLTASNDSHQPRH